MQEPIFDAIPVTYRGLFADQHLVDAEQFGKSLIGATKLANSICHEIFHEEITHDPRSYQIRFCVGPSKKNGLIQEIFAVVTSGQMPLYTPILMTVGKKLTELIIDAVIEKALGKKKDESDAVDKIYKLAMQTRRVLATGFARSDARQGRADEDHQRTSSREPRIDTTDTGAGRANRAARADW